MTYVFKNAEGKFIADCFWASYTADGHYSPQYKQAFVTLTRTPNDVWHMEYEEAKMLYKLLGRALDRVKSQIHDNQHVVNSDHTISEINKDSNSESHS